MVSYSLQERTRRDVIIWLLIGALLFANAVSFLSLRYFQFDLGDNQFGIRWYSLTVFAAFFFAFNRYVWRFSPVRHYLNIPNLNGVWIGTIDREEYPSREVETDVPVTVTIKQSFTTMFFSLDNKVETSMSKKTVSVSNNISINGSAETGFVLRESFDTGKFFGTTVWQVADVEGGLHMSGSYVSGFPRTGKLNIARIPTRHLYKSGLVQRMISENGEPYLAIAVSKTCGKDYLKKLEKKLGRKQVGQWSRNQIERDKGHYHLTVVSPPEFAEMQADEIAQIENKTVDYVMGDVGGVETADARAYYVIVASPHLAFLRKRSGLPHRDLHVTIAFAPDDIHGVVKGAGTRLP